MQIFLFIITQKEDHIEKTSCTTHALLVSTQTEARLPIQLSYVPEMVEVSTCIFAVWTNQRPAYCITKSRSYRSFFCTPYGCEKCCQGSTSPDQTNSVGLVYCQLIHRGNMYTLILRGLLRLATRSSEVSVDMTLYNTCRV